jgi:hypothetical protein
MRIALMIAGAGLVMALLSQGILGLNMLYKWGYEKGYAVGITTTCLPAEAPDEEQ